MDLKLTVMSVALFIERNLDPVAYRNKFPDSGITMYKERSALHKDFVYSFPESSRSIKDWDTETYQYYQDITYGSAPFENNIEKFYSMFLS